MGRKDQVRNNMEGFNSYNIKTTHRRGITDLKSIYAFHGASQGDDSEHNDIEVYKSGWFCVNPLFEDIDYLDSSEVIKRSAEIKKENDELVAKLKEEGTYGEEYSNEMNIHFKPIPMFDSPQSTLESYGILIPKGK